MTLPEQRPLNCTYNRDDVVAGLTQYYLTLTRTAYVPASYVDFPPPGGWTDADLDVGALRALRRSETVINLLRHLPYPRPMHDGPRPGPWNVAPKSKAVRYLRQMGSFSQWSDRGDAGLLELAALPMGDTPAAPMDLPPDVVCLTFGERISQGADTRPYWWIVDCSSGIFTPYQERSYGVAKVPRNKPWRTTQSYSVLDFFAKLVPDLGQNFLPVPPTEDLDAEVLGPSSTGVGREAAQIYQSHGWPSPNFRHDECIIALQAWRRRLQEEERQKIAQDVDDADDEDFEMDDSDDDDMDQGEAGESLAEAVADMEVDDLSAEAAALRADMSPEERARFDRREGQLPFEWVDSE
ncbi:alpha/beta hydrolase fold protein [Colletotrichum tofieldiae]|uniref:Alpha/beta hydrolase fold protein n=1 Tax=Colletotrichum tofieldiae TaxID=708197 RepID=A0A161VKF9_9PEZI|nr:alpha/beta hydrolase fold protein [Colletotrichum tofieldiae]GKT52877.1 alpha/beta hydrolase fold protein [Colletotrichum tofieldiae]GKT80727.1 alpha/beta hydrolase fold protein [Colletotrichum tofieldiae]GKT88856.1 alpha/beta hydrolase fold protein [Colletotrichum tofieldiae]